MILFLFGPDTFRSRSYLREQVERFKQLRDPAGYNVIFIDALEEKNGSKLWSEMLSSPFLAEKRMVVVENLLSSKHDEVIEKVTARINTGGFPDSNIIVFWEGEDEPKAKAKKDLFALLKKEKYATEFASLDDRKRETWIMDEVKKRGAMIGRDAVSYLSANSDGDLWLAHNVIEQVCAYTTLARPKRKLDEGLNDGNTKDPSLTLPYEGREITRQDVLLFLDPTADDNIFALVDAVILKQTAKAISLIKDQYKLGKEPQYILAMLIRQYRILIQMFDLFAREDGISSDMVAKKLGIHPFVVKKTLPLVKRTTLTELQSIHTQLFEIDKKTKHGANAAVLLDIFLLK